MAVRRTGKTKSTDTKDRDSGFRWWYEEDNRSPLTNIKVLCGLERPVASAPFDPAPPIHTSALAGSW